MICANPHQPQTLLKAFSAFGALAVLLSIVPAAVAQRQAVPDALERMNESIDALTKKVWPSVVQILVTSYGAREEGTRGDANVVVGRQRAIGSGFVIDADGYIMTNAHVVSGARRLEVVLPPPDASGSLTSALTNKTRVVPARIIGIASELDLAVLKIDGVKVPALPLATYATLRQGELVFAFGSPEGLRNTLTHGVVSAVARQIHPDSPLIYIQTDAPINPGNSGGPLVNVKGEVVGVNTFIFSQSGGNEGLGFAVPCATARTAFRQLKQFGQLRRQEIGIGIQTITPLLASALKLPRDYGVIISDVMPRSPASAAGLMVGDILLSVDDKPAEDLPTVSYSFRLRESGERIPIVVLRGTTQQTFNVAVIIEGGELDALSTGANPETSLIPELGVLAVEIDSKIASMARGLRDPNGIIVAARAAGSMNDVPLNASDVIREINAQRVSTLAELRAALRALKPGAAVSLQIQRGDKLMYIAFVLE